MFTKLKKGQLAFNRKTKEKGKVVGINKDTYAVEVILEQNKENNSRLVQLKEFPKVDTVQYRKPKGKNRAFREQKAVSEFHKAFNYPQSDKPVALSEEDIFKRVVFIQEELIELLAASVDTPARFLKYVQKLEEAQDEAVQKEFVKVAEKSELERIVAQVDALTDINVFTQGTGDMMGVDLLPAFKIVMEANMSKLGEDGKPIYNEFGKIQKGPNFIAPEPRLEEEIKRQIEKAKERK